MRLNSGAGNGGITFVDGPPPPQTPPGRANDTFANSGSHRQTGTAYLIKLDDPLLKRIRTWKPRQPAGSAPIITSGAFPAFPSTFNASGTLVGNSFGNTYFKSGRYEAKTPELSVTFESGKVANVTHPISP